MRLALELTDAGLAAIADADGAGTDDVVISEIGLTADAFTMAPTLTGIPGEFKRLTSFSGEEVAPNVVHITGTDTSSDTYDVRGIGLYLADGTLFATHSNADPVLSKAALAFALFSFDISFANDAAAAFTFGDNVFLYPPATRTVKGVSERADEDEADEGLDDERFMTPLLVQRVIAAYESSVAHERVPPRCPIAWYPADANSPVPTGWLLCDGSNGTPDLRDKFIRGGARADVGDIGGSDTHSHAADVAGHTLTLDQIPSHAHGNGIVDDNIGNIFPYGTKAAPSAGNVNNEPGGSALQGITESIGGGAEHDHGVTVETASSLPSYFTLAYIMRA